MYAASRVTYAVPTSAPLASFYHILESRSQVKKLISVRTDLLEEMIMQAVFSSIIVISIPACIAAFDRATC